MGEPRLPLGWGPTGIYPLGADWLIVISSMRRPIPPSPHTPTPTRGGHGACAQDPRRGRAAGSPAAEGQARGEGRRGAALGDLRPGRPCPPRRPFPSPTRAPSPRLRPPVSASSVTPLRLSSLPDLAKLCSRSPHSRPGHPSPVTPGKQTKTPPEADRPPGPSLLAPRRLPRPRPALLSLPGFSPPSPEGSPWGAREGPHALLLTVFPSHPPTWGQK